MEMNLIINNYNDYIVITITVNIRLALLYCLIINLMETVFIKNTPSKLLTTT